MNDIFLFVDMLSRLEVTRFRASDWRRVGEIWGFPSQINVPRSHNYASVFNLTIYNSSHVKLPPFTAKDAVVHETHLKLLKRSHHNGGAKCRWARVNAGAVAENWRLSTPSVVNLVRSRVYHTERICLQHVHRDVARRAGLSATADPC